MTNEQFVFWLQGRLEGRDARAISAEEIQMIQDKLGDVIYAARPPGLDPWVRRDPLVFREPSHFPEPWRLNEVVCGQGTLGVALATDA